MDEVSLQLVIAVFDDEGGAQEAAKTLKSVGKEEHAGIPIQAAVAVVKDLKGGIHYKDVGLTPAKGALGGVILGAALGILTGGVGIVLGALGALVGGIIGERKRGKEFSAVRLNEVVASLAPGTSAFVAVVEQEHMPVLKGELEQFEAEIFTAEVSADLAEQLDEHRHAAHTEWMERLGE